MTITAQPATSPVPLSNRDESGTLDGMATPGETRWRLGRRSELDGLRGVALLMVLLTHTHTPGMDTAGAVGVTVFFTLSGFLITSLLLEEREQRGRVNLAGFYARRARRLFPALVVVVAVVAGIWLFAPGFVATPVLVGAVTYSTNWMLSGGDYGFGGGALAHTWSLAIEEQFYLAWPLLLMACARLSRRWMLALIAGACVADLAWRAALLADGASVFRLYYGSDVRADNLLIGCGLAFLLHQSRRHLQVRGMAPLALLTLLLLVTLRGDGAVFVWMPMLVSLLAAAVIYAAVTGRGVSWLAWRPLTLLGRRSYALYLWHVPTGIVVSALLEPSATVAWLVTVPVSLVLTELSWRYVEQPFMRMKNRKPAAPLASPAPQLG